MPSSTPSTAEEEALAELLSAWLAEDAEVLLSDTEPEAEDAAEALSEALLELPQPAKAAVIDAARIQVNTFFFIIELLLNKPGCLSREVSRDTDSRQVTSFI